MVDDLEFYFETINGTLIILLAAALAFLSYYVVDQKRHRGLSWRDCIFDAPPGIGIALPMIGVKLGLLVTRGSRWTWQQFGGGEPMTTWQLHLSLVARHRIAGAALVGSRALARPLWRSALDCCGQRGAGLYRPHVARSIELSEVQSVDQRMRLEWDVGFRQLRTCRRTRPGQLYATSGLGRCDHMIDFAPYGKCTADQAI
jgi:hypothetical protein